MDTVTFHEMRCPPTAGSLTSTMPTTTLTSIHVPLTGTNARAGTSWTSICTTYRCRIVRNQTLAMSNGMLQLSHRIRLPTVCAERSPVSRGEQVLAAGEKAMTPTLRKVRCFDAACAHVTCGTGPTLVSMVSDCCRLDVQIAITPVRGDLYVTSANPATSCCGVVEVIDREGEVVCRILRHRACTFFCSV